MKKNKILYTEDLSIGYDRKAILENLNLSIEKGKLICLLGPNGTGKSTLLHTITGIQPLIKGNVFVNNLSVNKQNSLALSHLISIVLAQKLTPINLSVYDVVALGRTPYTNWLGHLSDKDHTIVKESMKLVDIHEFASRSINELSDGEKQRVMIAKALAQDTPLLILDEPTAHLDVSNRVALLSLLKSLSKKTNKAILLSTHELEMAIQLADSVWLITNDNKLKAGTPEDLILSGAMGTTFSGNRVAFDIHTGAFKIKHALTKKIALNGNGVLGYWTKQALEKEGYEIAPHSECDVQLMLDEKSSHPWKIKKMDNETKVNSIKKLKEILKGYS